MRLFDADTAAKPAIINISGQLKQPGQSPAAHFGVLAQLAPIDQRIPVMNAQTRVIGLKLDTLGALFVSTIE